MGIVGQDFVSVANGEEDLIVFSFEETCFSQSIFSLLEINWVFFLNSLCQNRIDSQRFRPWRDTYGADLPSAEEVSDATVAKGVGAG